MTRLIFLTFYGNERFELPGRRPDALPVVSGGSDDASRSPPPTRTPTATPRPPWRTATPVQYPAHPQPPHESPGTMTRPILRARRRSPRRSGHQHAVPRARLPRQVARAVVRAASPSARPVVVPPGRDARGPHGDPRARRHQLAYRDVPAGPRRADATRSNESSAASRPVLGNAYYYDDGYRAARRRPAASAVARFLDRVVDAKIIDGAVNGVGRLVRRCSRAPPRPGRLRAAATRSGSCRRRSCSSTSSIWVGR